MKSASFEATLHDGHKGAAAEVPFDPGERFGIATCALHPGRRGYRVAAKANGVAFDGAVVTRSGRFWLLVDEELRKRIDVAIGDSLRVSLAPASE